MATESVGTGHGVFGFRDEAAALADDGELREGEGVIGFEFGDPFGVLDGFFLTSNFLEMDGKGGVGDGMVGVEVQPFEPLGNRRFEVSLVLEFERFVVDLVLCCHRGLCLQKIKPAAPF